MWEAFTGLSGVRLEWCVMAAFAIDLALGDPRWLPHPVRLIGQASTLLEAVFTRLLGRGYVAGVLFTLLIVAGVVVVAAAILGLAAACDGRAGVAVQVLLLYTTLAVRDLDVESRRVFRALEAGDLPQARRDLSQIVGRETANLD